MPVSLDVDLQLKIENAVKSAAKASEQVTRQLDKIDKKAETTSRAVAAISFIEITRAAIDFGRAVTKVLGDAISEAIEADDAFNGLANSLKASGDFSQQNVAAFEDLADELARVSRFDDDLILSQVKLGKQFGLTNREVSKLIRASVEYASFTGEDLTTAVRQLGQTFDGTAGRLQEQVPALRGLSKEALQAGGALDVVIRQFSGSSVRDIQTFSGALEQTENQFGSIFENLGRGIVANPAVIESLRAVGELFGIVAKSISDSEGTFRELVTGSLQLAITGFGTLLEILAQVDRIATNINRFFSRSVKTAEALGAPLTEIQRIKEKIESQNNRQDFLQRLISASAQASANIEKFAKEQQKVISGNAKISDGFDDQINKNKILVEQQEQRLLIQEEFNRLIDDELKKRQAILKSLTQNPFGEPSRTNRAGLSFDQQQAGARGVGAASSVLGGRQGAVNLISQGAEFAGQAFLGIPGIGQLVGQLAQGPEAVRQLVKEFADAIPDVIVAIAEAIPVVLETLAEKLPDIITALAEKADRIIIALVRAMPAVAFALAKVVGEAAFRFVDEIARGATQFVGKILEGAFRFVDELIKGVGEAFNRLIDNINPLKGLGIGGGGDNPSGGAAVGAGIGFAVGGPVGALIGGIAGSLFGKGGGGGAGGGFAQSKGGGSSSSQPTQVVLKIGQRELAQAMLDVNRQGFRTT